METLPLSLVEAHLVLQELSNLQYPQYHHHKLCFSGRAVSLELDSSWYRTTIQCANKLLGSHGSGWSRDLNDLNPLLDKTIEVLNTEDLEAFKKQLKSAIKGLDSLKTNMYASNIQKGKILDQAISKLSKFQAEKKDPFQAMFATCFDSLQEGPIMQSVQLSQIASPTENVYYLYGSLLSKSRQENNS